MPWPTSLLNRDSGVLWFSYSKKWRSFDRSSIINLLFLIYIAVKCVFKRRDLICYDSKISTYRNLPMVVITVTEYNKAPGKLHCLWFVFSLPSYPSFLVLSITSFSNFRKTSPAAKVQLSLHNTLNFSAKSRQIFFKNVFSYFFGSN